MADYTLLNLKDDVEDMAPRFGYAPQAESRFARKPLELEKSGLSYFRLSGGFRFPFGHAHGEQEEIYVVLSGAVRMKLEDQVVELKPLDAIRVPGSTKRGLEGGSDGAEILVFGAPNTENRDAEMDPEFWVT